MTTYRGFFPLRGWVVVKGPGCETDHTCTSSAEVKNVSLWPYRDTTTFPCEAYAIGMVLRTVKDSVSLFMCLKYNWVQFGNKLKAQS